MRHHVEYGQTVRVRGVYYTVISGEPLGHLGSKYFGKYRFTLKNFRDGSHWQAVGRTVAGNTKLTPVEAT
jgi:hypothetical protein